MTYRLLSGHTVLAQGAHIGERIPTDTHWYTVDMTAVRSARGTAARLAGRRAEVVAAVWLMAKGYRILGFRLKKELEKDVTAEARVARGLAAGQTVNVIAAESGTSANTVRTHVNAVLAKTGYSRQADVVALLNGLRPPGSANDN